MRIYTTCATCGGQLLARHHRHTTHDTCPPAASRIDQLEAEFLAAAHAGQRHRADQLAREVDAYDNRTPRLLAAALAYAGWGWPVFPCVPGFKRPAVEHGLHAATTDANQIQQWWAQWPQANIGLPTGRAFDVIDVDPQGLWAWSDIRAHDLRQPDGASVDIHGQVSTPRGGVHIYIPPTGRGNLAGFLPGIDYRGRGGYVVAPPSVLSPAALLTKQVSRTEDLPVWPLRYQWWIRPSPTLTRWPAADRPAASAGGPHAR